MQTLLFSESPVIAVILSVALSLAIYYGYRIVSWVLAILLIFFISFYRYEPYQQTHNDNILVSPAEGRITNIRQTPNYTYITIFLSPFNRHYQIYPSNGTVITRYYDTSGVFKIVVDADKSRDNEKKIHYIMQNNGRLLKLTQIAGFLPRRITSSDQVPMQVKAGDYLGMIKFGSRVDLLFKSDNFKLQVHEGQKIQIGDQLGYYLN